MTSQNTLRLYRAITDRESKGIFSFLNGNPISELDENLKSTIPDEIYSHELSTFCLRQGIFYSFTDNYAIAKKFIEKHPEKYIGIGFIDVQIAPEGLLLPNEVIYLKRMCEISDWLDIAALTNGTFRNLNYECKPRSIITALVSGQKSVFSWASNSREYMAICNGLKLTMVDSDYKEPDWCKNPISLSLMPSLEFIEYYKYFIDELAKLNITNCRKKALKEAIDIYYHRCVAEMEKTNQQFIVL